MRRHKILPLIFLLGAGLILVRLFYWQVLNHQVLISQAEKQHFESLEIPALRGEIKAADGNFLVANKDAYLVFAQIPRLKKSSEEIARDLAPILIEETLATSGAAKVSPIDIKEKENEIIERLKIPGAFWVPLGKKISEQAKKKIESFDFAGIGFEEQSQRYYPEASMAAQLLGFVGQDSLGNDKGYFGLEGFYSRELEGRPGFLRQEKDARGRPILLGDIKRQEKEDGRTLVLNIDRSIQFIVEKKLDEGLEKYGAKGGTVIVANPKTGAILTMASRPSYDPHVYFGFNQTLYKNPAVSDLFEPGSIFKIAVMAAALNEKVVTPETRCDQCGGPWQVGEYSIRTWNNKYYPQTSMTEVLEHSDNVGMVFAAEKLGKEKLLAYLKNFGFGDKTGIDLQEEVTASLRPRNEWREIDLAVAGFGQGIAVTPIQMVKAVGVIANGGKIMTPQVVNKVIDSRGKVMEVKPKVEGEAIRPSTAKILTEMMINAVDKGEARWAKPKGFRIAGKTGTAQIPIAGHYDEQKTIASFIGFAPADDPKFLMLVTLREPSSSPWGSETAAPLWFNISRDLFTYFGITPGE